LLSLCQLSANIILCFPGDGESTDRRKTELVFPILGMCEELNTFSADLQVRKLMHSGQKDLTNRPQQLHLK